MSAVATQVPLSEFVSLFRGDADSDGYATAELAAAICVRFRPSSVGTLRSRIYGEDEPGEGAAEALEAGFARWVAAGRPR